MMIYASLIKNPDLLPVISKEGSSVKINISNKDGDNMVPCRTPVRV